MKKILLVLTLILTGLGASAQCNYQVELYDDFGDGWQGSTFEIFINGISTGPPSTGPVATSVIIPIAVNTGDVITFNYDNSTESWPGEPGWELTDALGNVLDNSGALATPAGVATSGGSYTVTCPVLCSGTPNPGATLGPDSICPGIGFTVSVANTPAEAGLTYQWQTSTDNITYTDVVGATATSYATTQAVATYYRCIVNCTNSGLADTSVVKLVGLSSYCPCEPIYTSGKTDGDLIANVEIVGTTLSNNTGTAPVNPAYTYFNTLPNHTADLQAGTSYTVNVSVGSFGNQNMAAWIDFNDDGVFDASERIGFTTASIGSFGSASFTISLGCSPPPGIHRLRIRDVWNTTGSAIDPCISYGWGETEDYDVNILPPPPCPSIINLQAINVLANEASLTWDTGCVETEWDVEISSSSDTSLIGAPSNPGILDDSLYVSGLMAGTQYYAHVRAVCGPGLVSTWITVPFTTTPPNDSCSTASVLTQGATCSYTFGSTVGATASGSVATCSGFGQTLDTWYSLTPTNSTIIINLDYGTANNLGFALYDACGGFQGYCNAAFPDSVDFTLAGLTVGATYFLQIFSTAADAGSYNICITSPPACAPPFNLSANNISTDSADLAWAEAGAATSWDIYLGLTGFDTTGTAPTFTGVSNPFTASGLLPATTYDFYVAGTGCNTYTGPFSFTTAAPPATNVDCGTAIAVGPGSTLAPAPVLGGGASLNCFAGPATNAVWYIYTPTITGTATITSDIAANLGIGLDTRLSVYTGSCGSLTCYDSSDDTFSGNINFASEVTISVCAGTTYYLEWDDRWAGGQQDFTFEIIETAACADPSTASITPTQDGFDATTTWTAGSGLCGGGYEWAVVADGGTPTFSGADLANGVGSYPIALPAVTGLMSSTAYDFYVRDICAGPSTSNDVLTNFTTLSPPPVNDDCANAIPVFGGYSISGFSTVGATVEAVDPTSCTLNDFSAVWFEYTPSCNTDVLVNTCGSSYDTNISIWDDCSYSNELACNDDDNANIGPCGGAGFTSAVQWTALAGVTYYIRIGGFNNATGNISFELEELTTCPCTQNVWTGATSTDWNDPTNWTCGIVPANDCASGLGSDIAIVPSGSSVIPVVTGTQGAASLTVGVGSSVVIDGTLQVCGNVDHDGNAFTGGGDLELNGTALQMLSGDGAFGFVELNNGAGASVMASASLSVDSGLILTTGTFTNNGSFSLNSALGGTAFLDDFTGSGSYSGNLTVNRFITDGFASGLGQRYFGSAVGASSAAGLDNTYASGYPVNGFILPVPGCLPDSIDPASPYSNLLEWREDALFPTSCVQEGWWALPTSATNLTPGRGYSGWMNNGSVVSVTGAPNTGGVSYTTTNSPSNSTTSRGYHVLSNPYPSPLNVDAVTLGSGLQSPQYYDATSGPWSGTFQPVLIAGTEIPVMQGFTAFSPGAGAFSPDNSYRVASTNGSFAKSNNWYDYRLDIEVSLGSGSGDITYLYYSGASTDQFDIAGDCEKRESDAGKPTLYTRNQGKMMSLNGLNLNDMGVSVPMGLITPESTTASFSFLGMDDFPPNTLIYLEDKVEGIFHNLNDGPYTFNTDVSENGTDRFEIHFALPASFNLIEPTCDFNQAIIAENTNDGRTITISNAGVLEQTTVLDGSENILPPGDYEIEVFESFGASQVYVFVIEEVPAVDASVLASATDIETGESVNFDYQGSGALNYQWFINGQLMAQTPMFSFQFDVPGVYEVEVRASNDVCDAIAVETITVAEKSTSIVDLGENGSLNIYPDKEANIVLDFTNVNIGEVQANVYNLLGQEVAAARVNAVGKQTISNVQWAEGYYIVKVQVGEEVVNQTVFIQK